MIHFEKQKQIQIIIANSIVDKLVFHFIRTKNVPDLKPTLFDLLRQNYCSGGAPVVRDVRLDRFFEKQSRKNQIINTTSPGNY